MNVELTREDRLAQASEEVRGAIRAFEQILEVIPNDLSSLESLWRAYSDVGDEQAALSCLFRLGEALEEQNDPETAARVLAAMRGAEYQDPRIAKLEASLSEICGEGVQEAALALNLRSQVNMTDELSFAWYLLQAEMLTEAEYAQIAKVLSELSETGKRGTISVLHALESIRFPRLERVFEYIVADLGVPYISVTAFDIGVDVSRLLPLEFMIGRGVIPFDMLDRGHVLVALLNPLDTALREEIETALNRRCHYFLMSALSFDESLKTIAERQAASLVKD